MVAFALVMIVSTFVHSLRTSILTWFEETLTADFLVTPTLQLDLPAGPTISGALEERLRRVSGVAEVSTSRMITVRVGKSLAVVRTESAGGFRRQHYKVLAGDVATYADRFARGDAVLVSDNFAYRHGVTAGDTVTLDTPTGIAALPIAAVVVDYTLDIGTIIVEHEMYRRLWRDETATGFRVWLAPGTDRNSLRQAIADVARPEFTVVVLTAAEFMRNIAYALDDALRMTYAIHIVAIAIAIIGVVNFFLAEVVDRRREIGLLRSVALTRRQVLRVFATEAGLLGTLGGAMAILEAWPAGHAVVTRSIRAVSGLGLTFVFPYSVALMVLLVTAGVSVLAALYPARQAATARVADLVTVE
jgi:putative ABC transport system permease protein